jgi:DNA invertase Pin-like site-specific DNA recombinase
MKVAIYLRVSQIDQSSIQQLGVLKEFCDKAGHEIVEVYQDEGVSAFRKNRPAFQRMLEDARHHKFQMLLVHRLDRYCRSLRELLNTLELLKSYKVGFMSYTERTFDTNTASGELMLHIVGAFANFEKNLISERTKLKLRYLQSQGMVLGRPRKLNYPQMMELRQQGKSLSQIASVLGCQRSTISRALRIQAKSEAN